MHPEGQIVDKDDVTQDGKLALGIRGRICKLRDLFTATPRKLGWGGRAQDLTPPFPNTWKTQGETGAPKEKGGAGDPTDHSSSYARILQTESRLSPDDPPCGHRTVWGDAGLQGQRCPERLRRPEPKSPSALTDRTPGAEGD